jgi:hypothetical protein
LAPTLPEERVKISWVTIDRFCQDEADVKEDVRRELERTGRPLRSSAGPLSDDELLAKLRDFGLDVDRDGVEQLCAGALSVEEGRGAVPVVAGRRSGLGLGLDRLGLLLPAVGRQAGRLRPGRATTAARTGPPSRQA